MERQLKSGCGAPDYPGIRLQQLIDGLVGNSLSIALSHGSIVRNEVGRGVILRKRHAAFEKLLQEVLEAVIDSSRRGRIHITVSSHHRNHVLKITEKNNYNGFALSYRIRTLAAEAAEMGSRLDIRTPRELVTTVVISFPPVAA